MTGFVEASKDGLHFASTTEDGSTKGGNDTEADWSSTSGDDKASSHAQAPATETGRPPPLGVPVQTGLHASLVVKTGSDNSVQRADGLPRSAPASLVAPAGVLQQEGQEVPAWQQSREARAAAQRARQSPRARQGHQEAQTRQAARAAARALAETFGTTVPPPAAQVAQRMQRARQQQQQEAPEHRVRFLQQVQQELQSMQAAAEASAARPGAASAQPLQAPEALAREALQVQRARQHVLDFLVRYKQQRQQRQPDEELTWKLDVLGSTIERLEMQQEHGLQKVHRSLGGEDPMDRPCAGALA